MASNRCRAAIRWSGSRFIFARMMYMSESPGSFIRNRANLRRDSAKLRLKRHPHAREWPATGVTGISLPAQRNHSPWTTTAAASRAGFAVRVAIHSRYCAVQQPHGADGCPRHVIATCSVCWALSPTMVANDNPSSATTAIYATAADAFMRRAV